ncbi:Rhodanese-like domain-containing protein [Chlamydoabsidia padenii]|nr:Rhodanese-like domain-containing protein [Chlamydoabsidia padenii]
MISTTLSKNVFTPTILTRSFTATTLRYSRWSDLVDKTKEQHQIQEISADKLRSNLSEPVLIDVREADEWKTGKLPGAVCIPRGIIELKVEKVVAPESDQPIVLYCAGGLRSVMVAASLVEMGYKKENIKSLKGGYGTWITKGYPVVSHDE